MRCVRKVSELIDLFFGNRIIEVCDGAESRRNRLDGTKRIRRLLFIPSVQVVLVSWLPRMDSNHNTQSQSLGLKF